MIPRTPDLTGLLGVRAPEVVEADHPVEQAEGVDLPGQELEIEAEFGDAPAPSIFRLARVYTARRGLFDWLSREKLLAVARLSSEDE